MDDGWVRLYRKSMKSQVYQDNLTWKLWSECIMRAAFTDRFVSVRVGRGMKTIAIKRGQLIYSRNQWAKRFAQCASSIDRRIKLLEKWGNVTLEPGNQYTVVTVCEYETYNPPTVASEQPSEQPSEQQTNSKRTANEQQVNRQTERKERKEPKERKERSKERKLKKVKKGKKKHETLTTEVILGQLAFPTGWDTPEVHAALGQWLTYKAGRGEAYKQPVLTLGKMLRLKFMTSPAVFIEKLDEAIAKDWKGPGDYNKPTKGRTDDTVVVGDHRYR